MRLPGSLVPLGWFALCRRGLGGSPTGSETHGRRGLRQNEPPAKIPVQPASVFASLIAPGDRRRRPGAGAPRVDTARQFPVGGGIWRRLRADPPGFPRPQAHDQGFRAVVRARGRHQSARLVAAFLARRLGYERRPVNWRPPFPPGNRPGRTADRRGWRDGAPPPARPRRRNHRTRRRDPRRHT